MTADRTSGRPVESGSPGGLDYLAERRKDAVGAFSSTPSYFAPHAAPFLALILVLATGQLLDLPRSVAYPVQTMVVAVLLLIYRRSYRHEIKVRFDATAIGAGILVFVLWIVLEGRYPLLGSAEDASYATAAAAGSASLVVIRLLGAALVVPLAEELFWRSFVMRYLIRSDFKAVPLGTFTRLSFIVTALAFGFEHHRWLPGIVAGIVYAMLLYRSKNLFSPILSHAVTNALLGVYVITTGKWTFW